MPSITESRKKLEDLRAKEIADRNSLQAANNNTYASGSLSSRANSNLYNTAKQSYLPTANATQNTYKSLAYSDLSKNLDPSSLQYSALTKGGSSYITKAPNKPTIIKDGGNGDDDDDGGYGGGIYGRANFQASDAYNQAMAYTNELLAKLSSGRTSYTDQINALMDTINNRASFAYDPDTDPLFQQYLASSMESGKTAMQDTMAQASALTGGYGSTYATAAANGAYNNFVQDAYNNLPEYYATALDAYNTETSNLYNKLNMYNVADETEYSRLSNAYTNNLAMANDMYGKEYNNYWDTLNYNTSIDQYNADLAYRYKALKQDNEQYYAKLATDIATSSASGGSDKKTESEWNRVYSDVDAARNNKGLESDELADTIQNYVNQGFDYDTIINHVLGNDNTSNNVASTISSIGSVVNQTPIWLDELLEKEKNKK